MFIYVCNIHRICASQNGKSNESYSKVAEMCYLKKNEGVIEKKGICLVLVLPLQYLWGF